MPAATGLGFDDHAGFHRVALGAGSGATLGAAAAALGPAAVAGVPASIVGALVGIAAGMGWAERPTSALRIGARLCAIAAGVGAASVIGSWTVTPLALAAVLIIGAPRARLAWAAPVAALAAVAAVWAAERVLGAAALASWSAPALDAASGLFLGSIAAGALAGRHVTIATDPILAAWRALPPLAGEPKALAERGLAIWHDSAAMRADDRALVAGGLTTLFAVAAKASSAPAIDATSIDARIAELDQRIAACSDPIAAAQFKDARAALADQQRYAASVAASRERIVARMHHCVATLETFRLACAHADVSAAAREAADARTAVAVLADLSDGLSEAARAADAPAALPAPAAAS
jgi:hypothetical protein